MLEATPAAALSAPAPSATPAADAPKAAPAPEAKPAAPETFTIKVNGKLKNLSREDALRELQKTHAARENFEKAATLTKKNQALLKALADPGAQEDALAQLGVDLDKLAEARLARKAQRAQMTPEQIAFEEREAALAAREKALTQTEAQRAQAAEEAQAQQLWARMEADYTAEIDRALKAGELGGLKPAEALFHMANEAELNLEFGLSLSPAELLAEAKAKVAEQRDSLRTQVLSLEGDALLDFLGPEVVNRISVAAVRRFKAGKPVQDLPKPAPIAPREPERPTFVRPGEIKRPWL